MKNIDVHVADIGDKTKGDMRLVQWDDFKILGIPNYEASCTLDDEPEPVTVKLGVIFEIMDLDEIKEPYEHEYPFCIEAQLVILDPISEAFYKAAEGCGGWEPDRSIEFGDVMTIFDYAGGIPVFMDSVKGAGNEKHESDFYEQKCAWFTGPWDNKYIQFKTEEVAREWIDDVYAPNMRAIFGLIGFALDRPVNRIGTTGWDLVRQWVFNRKPNYW